MTDATFRTPAFPALTVTAARPQEALIGLVAAVTISAAFWVGVLWAAAHYVGWHLSPAGATCIAGGVAVVLGLAAAPLFLSATREPPSRRGETRPGARI